MIMNWKHNRRSKTTWSMIGLPSFRRTTHAQFAMHVIITFDCGELTWISTLTKPNQRWMKTENCIHHLQYNVSHGRSTWIVHIHFNVPLMAWYFVELSIHNKKNALILNAFSVLVCMGVCVWACNGLLVVFSISSWTWISRWLLLD